MVDIGRLFLHQGILQLNSNQIRNMAVHDHMCHIILNKSLDLTVMWFVTPPHLSMSVGLYHNLQPYLLRFYALRGYLTPTPLQDSLYTFSFELGSVLAYCYHNNLAFTEFT